MLREALTLDRLRAMEPDDAAALFLARRAEGLTASEEALLDDWLGADSTHAEAFIRAERGWNVFDSAAGDEILAAMRAHALDPPVRRWTHWPRAVAAAAVVVLVVAAGLLLNPFGRAPGGNDPTAPIEYASARGEVRDIALPDGSVMTLDADSAAQGRFGARGRSIELRRGRAFFDVRHDGSRPFAVTAANRRVVAIGTRFEVDVAGGGLRVTLVQGRVAVERPGTKPIMLAPGQQFVEAGGADTVRSAGVEGDRAAAWRSGLVDFDDRPLSEAVAEINRHSRAQILVRDPAVGALRISGQFRTGDSERFARAVAEVHPVRVLPHGNQIELVAK